MASRVVAPVTCEKLEPRTLLATYTYVVPAGHAAAYLQPGAERGQVDVRLDSPTNPVARTFTNTTGMNIIECGSNLDFLFVDQIPARFKPTSDGTHDGIMVRGGNRGTLRIEAGDDDTLIRISGGSVLNTPVEITDGDGNVGRSRLGSGTNHLVIRTHDAQAKDYFPNGGTDVIVSSLPPSFSLSVDTGDATYARVFLRSIHRPTIKTGAGHNIVEILQNPAGGTGALVDFGAGSGTGTGLGLGNVLNIHGIQNSARLMPIGGDHVVAVDEVNVFNGGGLIVGGASTLGQVKVFSGGEASIEAPVTIDCFEVDGIAGFTGTSAPSTVGVFDDSDGTVELLAEANITVLKPSYINNLFLDGNPFPGFAFLQFQTTGSHVTTLTVLEGLVTLQDRAGAPPSGNARVLTVNVVYMGDPNSPRGALDLRDNALIVDHPGSSPLPAVQALIASSYANGAWTGLGIGSSSAAAESHTGLGYAEVTDIFTSFPASFEGQTVDDSAVLVKYTFYGDANLDGAVTLRDFNTLAGNFDQAPRGWAQGDFDYNALVSLADFNRLVANFGQTGLGSVDESELDAILQAAITAAAAPAIPSAPARSGTPARG